MSEEEPIPDLGLGTKGQDKGCQVILGNWGVVSLLASSKQQGPGRLSGQGSEHHTPLYGDAVPFLLQQEPAQEIQHHWMRAWTGLWGECRKGEAQDGPES